MTEQYFAEGWDARRMRSEGGGAALSDTGPGREKWEKGKNTIESSIRKRMKAVSWAITKFDMSVAYWRPAVK